MSCALLASSSSVSFTMLWKSAVPIGWNTIPATPRCLRSSDVSSVICAVVIANSRSGAGPFSLFPLPPRRASRKPTNLGGGALQLGLELLEPLDALLERRVRGEERLEAPLTLAGTMKNAFMFSACAQVLRGHLLHLRPRSAPARRRARSGGR